MTLQGKQEIILSKTVEEIEHSNRVADILRILLSASISLGANRISYHLTPKLHSQTDESVHLIAEGFPKRWIELYEHEHLREHDPIPDIVMQHGEPMLWHAHCAGQLIPATIIERDCQKKAGIFSRFLFRQLNQLRDILREFVA